MSQYAYVAVEPDGSEAHGTLDVADQTEALRRIREMGLFPTRLFETGRPRLRPAAAPLTEARTSSGAALPLRFFRGRVKSSHLAIFTRQLATLVEAGMPLLRSLRVLEEQEENRALKQALGDVSLDIENGRTLAEAAAAHPRIFNPLYVNMVRAGEIGGALETTLGRLAEFMEKAQRIKGKIKAALVYPCAVLLAAVAILGVMVTFVVPRFKLVFDGLMEGAALPTFTLFVFHLSDGVTHHWLAVACVVGLMPLLLALALRTGWGRQAFDQFKLSVPLLGPLFRKAAISRFAGTLGTLIGSGVPILQALSIVKETAGNCVVGGVIGRVRENVKQGEPIAPTLKASALFPAMVAGMVDVGEQTGALPEMLMKIADNYDAEVDNAASAMTSLLEPILIMFLAVVVGGVVIALYLPIIYIVGGGGVGAPGQQAGE